MELQTVKIGNEKLIPSSTNGGSVTLRHSGIAKVLWRKLDVEYPISKVIENGVNIYK